MEMVILTFLVPLDRIKIIYNIKLPGMFHDLLSDQVLVILPCLHSRYKDKVQHSFEKR